MGGAGMAHLPETKSGRAGGLRIRSSTIGHAPATAPTSTTSTSTISVTRQAASRLAERGWNILKLAAVTGRQDLQMLKRYTNLRAADLAIKLSKTRGMYCEFRFSKNIYGNVLTYILYIIEVYAEILLSCGELIPPWKHFCNSFSKRIAFGQIDVWRYLLVNAP